MHGESSETRHPASSRKKKNAGHFKKRVSHLPPRRSDAFDVISFLTSGGFALLAHFSATPRHAPRCLLLHPARSQEDLVSSIFFASFMKSKHRDLGNDTPYAKRHPHHHNDAFDVMSFLHGSDFTRLRIFKDGHGRAFERPAQDLCTCCLVGVHARCACSAA